MTNSEIKRHAVGNAPRKQSFRAFQDPRSCLAYSTCHMEPDHNVMNEIALLTKPVVMSKDSRLISLYLISGNISRRMITCSDSSTIIYKLYFFGTARRLHAK